ncbi:hypothetical protein P7M20_33300, partial [Vibrio parahaemolyticus]|nr:hypothetical protein [Vibrio parahaemolyticus]
ERERERERERGRYKDRETETEIETDRDIGKEIQKETKMEKYDRGPEMEGDRSITPEGRKVSGSITGLERGKDPGVSTARL